MSRECDERSEPSRSGFDAADDDPSGEGRSSFERTGPPDPRREGDADGDEWRAFFRDVVTSILAVLLVGAYLFMVSGVWPPLVAVESGSMLPNMEKNDLVFVMEETRFVGQETPAATGVVTASSGDDVGYRTFGGYGDVIVYEPDGQAGTTPIIHRAMFWVEESENWFDRARPAFRGQAADCDELANCPAPHAGFITKGDHNRRYDQVAPSVLSQPVRPSWIVGTAEVRVPGLGWLRLQSR